MKKIVDLEPSVYFRVC